MSLPHSPSLSSAHGIFLPLQPSLLSRPVSPLSPRLWTMGMFFPLLRIASCFPLRVMMTVIITAVPVSPVYCFLLSPCSLPRPPLGTLLTHLEPPLVPALSSNHRLPSLLTPDCFLFCFVPRLLPLLPLPLLLLSRLLPSPCSVYLVLSLFALLTGLPS